MNAHPQYAEALALYAIGTLDNPEGLAALEAHLGTCGDCRRELETLRADVALLVVAGENAGTGTLPWRQPSAMKEVAIRIRRNVMPNRGARRAPATR